MLDCEWMESLLSIWWDMMIEVLHFSKNTHQAKSDHCRKGKVDDPVPRNRARVKSKAPTPTPNRNETVTEKLMSCLMWITSAKPSQFEAPLYICEDNEAVIKMVIKGRSPSIRHVGPEPTELRWIGCLTEINLDLPNPNQICWHQKTNSLTCWLKVLLHVMRGVIFFVCSTSWISRCLLAAICFLVKTPNTMSKRAQERRSGEELVVAKSRPVSLISRSFELRINLPMLDSGTSYSPGNCRLGWNSDLTSTEKSGRDRSESSASSSHVSNRDDNPFPSTERSGREMNQRSRTGKPGREEQNQLTEVTLNHHNLEISNSRYIEEVFANVRTTVESSRRRPDSAGPKSQYIDMGIIYVNKQWKQRYILEKITMTTCSFTYRNTNFEALKTLFDLTQKLILNQKHEIRHGSTIEWPFATWSEIYISYMKKYSSCQKQRYMSISDSVLLSGQDAQTSRSHGKVERTSLTFSRFPTNTENYLETTENHLSSSGMFSQDVCRGDPQRDSDKNDSSQNNTWRIWRADRLHVYVQRHWLESTRNVFSNPEMERDYARKFPLGRRSFLRSWWRREMVWNAKVTNLKDIHFSELPVRWIGDSWKRKVGNVRFTSVRVLRMQSFNFAWSILQISSVSTKQSRIGVMNWLSRVLVNHFLAWKNPLRTWVKIFFEIGAWGGEYVGTHTHLRRMVKQREIDCVIAKRSSKIYQKRLGYLRFVNRLDSWGKSPLDYASEQFTAWMMVWEERQEHSWERTLPPDDQDSELIGWIRGHNKIGPVLQVRVTCCLDQCGNEIQVPSVSRSGSCSWVVISRGPSRYVDESWHDQEDPPQALRWWGLQAMSNHTQWHQT